MIGNRYAYALTPFFYIVFLKTAFCFVNQIAEFFSEPRYVFRMDYPEVADENKTAVVISEFIGGREQLFEAIRRAEVLSASNDGKNIEYALLIDLPKSERETDPKDAEILHAIKEYDGNLSFFVRKREKLFSGYGAKERKRGAVMALARYAATGAEEEFTLIKRSAEESTAIKFFVFLDDDNELLPGSVKGLINGIIHPLNDAFDLMTLAAKYNMYSIGHGYAKRFLNDSGIESYPYYSGLFYKLFNREIFTGKGIVRAHSLYNKLYGKLPENRVLSHDIIEGAVLNSVSSGTVTFEDAPKDFSSDTDRYLRWSKGDLLLLIFLKNRVRDSSGKRIPLRIPPLYKTIIAVNAAQVLNAFCLFAVLGTAYFFGLNFLGCLFAMLFARFLSAAFSAVTALFSKSRLRYKVQRALRGVYREIRDFLISPFYAVSGIVLSVKTIHQLLFNQQKVLEWKTFYHSQKNKKRAIGYLIPSFLVFTILAVVGYILFGSFTVAAAAAVYAAAFLLNSEIGRERKKTHDQRTLDLLEETAEKTYKFFEENLKENPLICDNLQIEPSIGTSDNTSPTNIGFSALAEVARYFIATERGAAKSDRIFGEKIHAEQFRKAYDNLERITAAAEKLPKKWGHLYNWYDIRNRSVLHPSFVSSVDSANFVTAMITVKEFLQGGTSDEKALSKEEREECDKLISRIERLTCEADFSKLYDFKRDLFYIGYNAESGEYAAHYDLLASESRLLSYLGAINSLPCWFKLGRKIARAEGNTLYSWSGTMFEYLMADIFLKSPKGSLLYRSSKNAARVQSKTKCKGFFGLSESGYYRFDENMKYQYQAFGVNTLSLKSKTNECVIAPYASFLALKTLDKKAVKNLLKLKSAGLMGEYGFFEAKDFNADKTVASYMAHHQGMILCSIANYLSDNVLCRLFMNDERIASGRNLLAEKNIEVRSPKSVKNNLFLLSGAKTAPSVFIEKPQDFPYCRTISNGNYHIVADESGRAYSVFDKISVTKENEGIGDPEGKYLYIDDGESMTSPTYAPLFTESRSKCAEFFSDKCVYTDTRRCAVHTVRIPTGFSGEIHSFQIKNDTDRTRNYRLCFFGGDIVLGDRNAYLSHKNFYNMFVTMKNPTPNCVTAERKRIYAGDKNYYAAMLVKGLEKIEPICSRYHFIGRNRTLKNPIAAERGAMEISDAFPNIGDVLEPCFGFSANAEIKKGESLEFSVVIVAAKSEDERNELLRRANTAVFDKLIKASPEPIWYERHTVLNEEECEIEGELLTRILYVPLSSQKLHDISERENSRLYRDCSENFEAKLLYYKHVSDRDEGYLVSLLKVFNRIHSTGIAVRFVLCEPRFDPYHDPIKRLVRRYVRDFSSVILIGNDPTAESLFEKNAFVNLNEYRERPFGTLSLSRSNALYESDEPPQFVAESQKPKAALYSGAGYFTTDGGYCADALPALPYSNVIAGVRGGCIVTDNGGGYTFFQNSRENKGSALSFDPVSDTASESLCLMYGNKLTRINRRGAYFEHKNGETVFFHDFDALSARVSTYMILDGGARVYEVGITNKKDRLQECAVLLDIELALGSKKNQNLYYEYHGDSVTAANPSNGQTVILKTFGGEVIKDRNGIFSREGRLVSDCISDEKIPAFSAIYTAKIRPSGTRKMYFVFASGESDISALFPEEIDTEKQKALNEFKALNNIRVDTCDKYLDTMFNHRLMYQLVSSRIRGRCGFYQAGGAVGFRDQLQDMLGLLYRDPAAVREHILLCAARQYTEGDVMHWWHSPRLGVRTRISDDKLFLPYAAFAYIHATGDDAILKERVPYLKSEPLFSHEHSRMETPKNAHDAPLSEHLERAIESALRYGEHDLLLMGSGDWNDALDHIGVKGRGESVWLSMFAYKVLTMYKGTHALENRLKYIEHELRLKKAVDSHGYDGAQYKRAFTDDGEWLGSRDGKYCTLDLLSQSWAVLSGIGDKRKTDSALDRARMLIDRKKNIVKLFEPPFTPEKYFGYISSYPYGTRENGGQYTHAVMWYISALFHAGRADEGYDILSMINPARIMATDGKDLFLGEPYVLSADVSTGGRAGWSWYTGSASLMYRVILEDMLGITLRNNMLSIKPNLPSALERVKVEYRRKDAVYRIEIIKKQGIEKGFLVNGVNLSGNYGIALKDEGSYEIKVFV
ncbi:MAG: hypothetical protein LBT20_03980 [Clostridiales bacterium]|nr:hypothetical protein [Clostridiales bacterium]